MHIDMNSYQLLQQINLLQACQQQGEGKQETLPPREPSEDHQFPHSSTATFSIHAVAPAAPCHLCPAEVVSLISHLGGACCHFQFGRRSLSICCLGRETSPNCHLLSECRKHQLHRSPSELAPPATSFLSGN